MAEHDSLERTRQQLAGALQQDDGQEQQYEDGFSIKTVIGALFIGFIMLPGAMYLGLVAGQGLGEAAKWVTIVLFAEVARRSFIPLKRQEIYILYYVAGGLAGMVGTGLAGAPFSGPIWNQYLVQSPQIGELAKLIPSWVVPGADSPALAQRTFFHPDWMIPIGLLLINEVLGRLYWISAGHALFRLTSDIERLPFPMAPIAAAGATALSEAGNKEESWRWQVFSIGSMAGLVFGFVYLFIPIITGLFLAKPLNLIPMLFFDFTSNTERIMPAALTAVSSDIGSMMIGFVIPFPIVIGQFISSVLTMVVTNPFLYHQGMFPQYKLGMNVIQTEMAVRLDFWMSVGVGTGVAVGLIGLYSVIKTALTMREQADRPTMRRGAPAGRGDWPVWISLATWFVVSVAYIVLAHILVPEFPLWILVALGLVWTPLNSYVSARLIGLTGAGVGFPYLREAIIIKSGYKKADIWFAHVPMADLGGTAQRFREVELTGTKFTSVLKAELLMFCVLIPASFIFWSFFWHTSPIPAPQFQFAQKMWPLNATMGSIWWTANQEGQANFLLEALKFDVAAYAGVASIVVYWIFMLFKAPILFFYGFIGGVGAAPIGTIPMFAGSLLGKLYFAKRFGPVRWSQYAPVLLAGWSCGMGLIGMSAVAFALISKSVQYLPF